MNKSESIENLAKALSKFQAEVKNPANTANNPFFKSKYAPLNEILNDVRPLLSKYGLSVLQVPGGDGQDVVITTLLLHDSGEWIETYPLNMKPAKNDPQGIGSCITYGRRYSLAAVLGISSEDDDDGNVASHGKSEPDKKDKPKAAPPPKPAPKKDETAPNPDGKIDQKAMAALHAKAKELNMPHETLSIHAQEKYGVSSLTELTMKQGRELYAFIAKPLPKEGE
jgi:hypothetical protein